MQTPRKLFVNLPVADLDRSVSFFSRLGFSFDPRFTDETATCMLIGEDAYSMLIVEPRFREFANKQLVDTSSHAEVLVCVSASAREEVDELADTALEAGGSTAGEPQDQGFMYSRGFHDPDGHQWTVMWMDESVLEHGPHASASAA
jgi:uncharacterized protein